MKRPRVFTLTLISVLAFIAPFVLGETGVVIRYFLIGVFAVVFILFQRNPKAEPLSSNEVPSLNLSASQLDRDETP